MIDKTNVLIHPRTLGSVKTFIKDPAQALLLTGPTGSGKTFLAYEIVAGILALKPNDLTTYPYFTHIVKEDAKNEISISESRKISQLLSLKVPGKTGINRVILIEDAQYLSAEAQNALLKNLEEPSPQTVLILTVPSKQNLIPTIVSRCQEIEVVPISLEEAQRFYTEQYSAKKIEAAWQLSQGSPGFLHALLKDDTRHPLRQAIDEAKRVLKLSSYEQTYELEKLFKDKHQVGLFLAATSRLLTAVHHKAIATDNKQQANILANRRLITEIDELSKTNVNSKLLLLNLILRLKSLVY